MIINNTTVVDQTSAIERIKPKNGLFGALGLYRDETVSTDAVTFDVRDNEVSLLDDHLRNVAQKNSSADANFNVHTLAIPHYPIVKTIGREKLAGVRAFGKEGEAVVAQAVAEELERQAERHDNNLEYLKAVMTLTGTYTTTNYGTVNMGTELGANQQTETINVGTVVADLQTAMGKVKAGLRNGGRVQGYVAFMSTSAFGDLIQSSDIKDAYQFSQANGNPLRNELGTIANGYTMFRFGNIDFILYDDLFVDAQGNNVDPMNAIDGVLVPRTTLGRTFFAPASTLSGLGKAGSKRFATSFRDPKDRYIEVESEQSVLVINEQIGATVKLTVTP